MALGCTESQDKLYEAEGEEEDAHEARRLLAELAALLGHLAHVLVPLVVELGALGRGLVDIVVLEVDEAGFGGRGERALGGREVLGRRGALGRRERPGPCRRATVFCVLVLVAVGERHLGRSARRRTIRAGVDAPEVVLVVLVLVAVVRLAVPLALLRRSHAPAPLDTVGRARAAQTGERLGLRRRRGLPVSTASTAAALPEPAAEPVVLARVVVVAVHLVVVAVAVHLAAAGILRPPPRRPARRRVGGGRRLEPCEIDVGVVDPGHRDPDAPNGPGAELVLVALVLVEALDRDGVDLLERRADLGQPVAVAASGVPRRVVDERCKLGLGLAARADLLAPPPQVVDELGGDLVAELGLAAPVGLRRFALVPLARRRVGRVGRARVAALGSAARLVGPDLLERADELAALDRVRVQELDKVVVQVARREDAAVEDGRVREVELERLERDLGRPAGVDRGVQAVRRDRVDRVQTLGVGAVARVGRKVVAALDNVLCEEGGREEGQCVGSGCAAEVERESEATHLGALLGSGTRRPRPSRSRTGWRRA